MGKVILKKSPRYAGLTELIPGHVYRDNKGVGLVFLGWIEGHWEEPAEVRNVGGSYGFHYLKLDQFKKHVEKGKVDKNLGWIKGTDEAPGNPLVLLYVSEKPRQLMEDLGEMFPENYFDSLLIHQAGSMAPDEKTWTYKLCAQYGDFKSFVNERN